DVVVHRANIARITDIVDLAIGLKASRIRISPVRYRGWAIQNRAALMPAAQQTERAMAGIEALQREHQGRIVIETALGDPCIHSLTIPRSGRVADWPAGVEPWTVRDHSVGEIWAHSRAFNVAGPADETSALGSPGIGAALEERPY